MGLITSAGVGSGIDIERIIQVLIDAERAPKEASLRRNEQRVESTLSAIGQLSSALSTLDEALNSLNSIADFRISSAISSDEDVLTAVTNEETSSGSFEIDVTKLAQGSRLESLANTFTDVTDTVGQGTLTFTAGTQTFNVDVQATDSLETIRDNINSNSENFGVNANIINGSNGPILVFSSSVTGDANTLVVSNNDASLDSISTSMSTVQAAGSATIQIDGITVTSDSNTFTNAIQDATFTVYQETAVGSPITLDIDLDKDGIKEAINSFIDAVNDFQSTAQKLGASSENATGALAGDVTLRLLTQQVVTTLQDSVSGLTGDYTSLNSIGITFDEFGKLSLDETAIDKVLDTNFDAISDIFATTDTGVSLKIQDLVDNYISSGGILDIRESSLNDQKRRLETDRLNFDYRISQLETQLRNKFGAMDALVAQFNNTSSFLSAQLATLPGTKSSSSS